jgi:hypothetical protein
MEVWILNARQGCVVSATLIRSIDAEEVLIRYDDGQRMSVPRRFLFSSKGDARRALAEMREFDCVR